MNKIWEKTLRPGEKWSGSISRSRLIKFTALEKGANLAVLLYNDRDPAERYNMPDTLKAQHTSMLTRGNVLMSDNGRVLASIVEDSTGWNDTIAGITTRKHTDKLYGKTSYQEKQNNWLRSGYENLAVELVRNGLGLRDLVPAVNLFSKAWCDESGDMHYKADHCKKGDFVTLRTELDVLLLLSNTPNPLDKREEYPSVPVLVELFEAAGTDFDDFCVNYRAENRRAFENTWDYCKLIDWKGRE